MAYGLEELANRDVERVGQCDERKEREVFAAAFDLLNPLIRRVDPERQGALRQTLLHSKLADPRADELDDSFGVVARHACTVAAGQTRAKRFV